MDEPESAPKPMPADPVSDLVAMATGHHVMFEAYKNAGFTPSEALTLVLGWIARP